MATAAIRLPERWQDEVGKDGSAFADFIEMPDNEAAREHLLMNLRLAEGLDLAAYEVRWGTRPAAAKIAGLIEQGVADTEGQCAPPPRRRAGCC